MKMEAAITAPVAGVGSSGLAIPKTQQVEAGDLLVDMTSSGWRWITGCPGEGRPTIDESAGPPGGLEGERERRGRQGPTPTRRRRARATSCPR